MDIKVSCTKSFFHSASGRYYEAGREYTVTVAADLANFFAFAPELRAQLRAEHAKKFNKAAPNLAKAAARDLQELAEVAHAKSLVTGKDLPTTLHALTGKPKQIPTDKPVALSQITDADFLG